MRGKEKSEKIVEQNLRITPAYAGKSYRRISADPIHQDHPRLCGEKLEMLYPVGHFGGSPPPMRGKAFRKICNDLFNRITPAYAGKSHIFEEWTRANKDHPRLCGEKFFRHQPRHRVPGSPPPMRGKAQEMVKLPQSRRITPAYAGKSFFSSYRPAGR